MGLTKTQQTLITKARTASGSELGIALDDNICTYLTMVIIKDLGLLQHFPDISADIPAFFGLHELQNSRLNGFDFQNLLEQLITLREDADTYFYCLAILHKARLKYERILQTQAIPTIDQVGPRGLLQYGSLGPKALAGFLFWRKWLFDIDNRAGQETGYLFEPIIAYAIGGVPYSAKKSPVTRAGEGSSGRQVDCIRDQKAYEIKIRVTIAASGQGRWGEELEFPRDCQASGYIPILVVLDPTPNPKLEELKKAFTDVGGESYVGAAAWGHLAAVAGPTMARFLELYVHEPIQTLLQEASSHLPDLTLKMDANHITIVIDQEILVIERDKTKAVVSDQDKLPEDIDQGGPGL